jgi:hypothetical protein|tara:strand:- start:95 stop:232 length:138 start_codon:yes stop_codon:yes gene_type:complete
MKKPKPFETHKPTDKTKKEKFAFIYFVRVARGGSTLHGSNAICIR